MQKRALPSASLDVGHMQFQESTTWRVSCSSGKSMIMSISFWGRFCTTSLSCAAIRVKNFWIGLAYHTCLFYPQSSCHLINPFEREKRSTISFHVDRFHPLLFVTFIHPRQSVSGNSIETNSKDASSWFLWRDFRGSVPGDRNTGLSIHWKWLYQKIKWIA